MKIGSLSLSAPFPLFLCLLSSAVVCAADRTSHPRGEYYWAKSRPGTVELPCQHSEEGVAKRQCSRDGIWDHPILDECYGDIETVFRYLDKVSQPREIYTANTH